MRPCRLSVLSILSLSLLEILLALSPIGFPQFGGGLELTFLSVPVGIGAILFGPLAGFFLGTIFGLSSFAICFTGSMIGSSMAEANFAGTFFICVLPRACAGFLTGYLFQKKYRAEERYAALQNSHASTLLMPADHPHFPSFFFASLSTPVCNTFLFSAALFLLFYHSDFIQGFVYELGAANLPDFFLKFIAPQALIELCCCSPCIYLCSRFFHKNLMRHGFY